MTTLETPTESRLDTTRDLQASESEVKAQPQFMRETGDDGVCILTFDRPNSSANVFDLAALRELDCHLLAIQSDRAVRGVIIISAKKSIFIAGADLHALSTARNSNELCDIIELGQNAFNRLAALPVPTVAAIHGACLGGGYELALACNYRIASPDKATKIGLPETQLGILPAWGGSTRLPRLIGLPAALDVILGGKTLAAKAALKRGMIDELVPCEYMLDVARKRILERGKGLRHRPSDTKRALANSALARKLIFKRVSADVMKRTRGRYPAIPKALEVCVQGLGTSIEQSLRMERDAVVQLAQSEACKNLIRIFFLQERAKKLLSKGDTASPPVGRMCVIGAGVMGAGIAQWSSARGIQVILRDINPEQVAKGMATSARLYNEGLKRYAFTKVEARAGMDRIFPTAGEVPLGSMDVVIEAAVERMDLKKQIFQRLDDSAGANTILATNTSALSITEIASATKQPERVVGIHFFNPVHKMQLVEVVVGRQTSPEVVRRAVRYVQQIGKLPVVVKDSPGFLVNRILLPYLMEAGLLFEAGARVEDIDQSMLDFGMPMGPLRLIDEVGLDVANHVSETMAAAFSPRLCAPKVLSAMLKAGLLGRKSGAGFYLHKKGKGEPAVNTQLGQYQTSTRAAGFSQNVLRDRLVLLMVNEAARCLEEGVVDEPADVDFGMIMGTGFAPFLGGPLRFADFTGLKSLADEMQTLADAGETRFEPCNLIKSMADKYETFYQH
jgi:3-hydroxyacyl-CoA dehydrogenase / enoyl-CoA hydratase / 3-hydroxybutyryl-CoA epimerase